VLAREPQHPGVSHYLIHLVRGTDSDRPEINEAKVFLARR
jgi:hypothetical protein